MPGPAILPRIFRTMLRAGTPQLRRTNCWRAMAAPGVPSNERILQRFPMAEKRKISLVLVDVDGTLVTEQKVLTERAQAAVQSLRKAGIRFAITSGRPPKGMAMLFDALKLDTPIAGFNGGLFVKADLTILCPKTVP